MGYLLNREEWSFEIHESKYLIKEIIIESLMPDHKRKLFRIKNLKTGKIFYKGISISRTNLTVYKNNNQTEDGLWEQNVGNFLERALVESDESSKELIVGDSFLYKDLNEEDGAYKN